MAYMVMAYGASYGLYSYGLVMACIVMAHVLVVMVSVFARYENPTNALYADSYGPI